MKTERVALASNQGAVKPGLLQIVDLTGLLQVVNKLQQVC